MLQASTSCRRMATGGACGPSVTPSSVETGVCRCRDCERLLGVACARARRTRRAPRRSTWLANCRGRGQIVLRGGRPAEQRGGVACSRSVKLRRRRQAQPFPDEQPRSQSLDQPAGQLHLEHVGLLALHERRGAQHAQAVAVDAPRHVDVARIVDACAERPVRRRPSACGSTRENPRRRRRRCAASPSSGMRSRSCRRNRICPMVEYLVQRAGRASRTHMRRTSAADCRIRVRPAASGARATLAAACDHRPQWGGQRRRWPHVADWPHRALCRPRMPVPRS